MKPFSFTKRDEEIQELTREISKSSPNLYQDPPLKIKKFKAKPIPRNLFSNYIYKKMHEDEFYRLNMLLFDIKFFIFQVRNIHKLLF